MTEQRTGDMGLRVSLDNLLIEQANVDLKHKHAELAMRELGTKLLEAVDDGREYIVKFHKLERPSELNDVTELEFGVLIGLRDAYEAEVGEYVAADWFPVTKFQGYHSYNGREFVREGQLWRRVA